MKKVRRPIEEMLAGASQGNQVSGLICPGCGCPQFADGKNVRNTVRVNGAVRRYRVCRNCGRIWTTTER